MSNSSITGSRRTQCCVPNYPSCGRYSVNLVDRQRFPKFGYDGFSELWFDSEEDLVAALSSPEGKTLLADLPNFAGDIDPIISVETQVLWP